MTALSHRCRCLRLFALYLVLPRALAERNYTVNADDASIEYTPAGAWSVQPITAGNVGSQNAKVSDKNGATATLRFNGTAVYFQTISAAANGVSTINLDGTDFEFDSGLKKGTEETGAMWGVVSLKDTEHTISVTQSADTGTQLSIKAFVYTTSEEGADQEEPQRSSSAFDAGYQHFARNVSLLTVGCVLAALVLGSAIYYTWRRRKEPASVVAIQLAASPQSPTSTISGYTLKGHLSKHKQDRASDAGSCRSEDTRHRDDSESTEERTSVRAPSVQSYVSHKSQDDAHDGRSQARMTIPEALRQARNIHRLDTNSVTLSISQNRSSTASSTHSNELEDTLSMQWRGPSPVGTSPSGGRLSGGRLSVPTSQGWDGFSSISPEAQSRLPPARASGNAPIDSRIASSEEPGQHAGSSGLSIASSQFPAGFSVYPGMEPPPAYVSMYVPPGSRGQHSSTYKGRSPP